MQRVLFYGILHILCVAGKGGLKARSGCPDDILSEQHLQHESLIDC